MSKRYYTRAGQRRDVDDDVRLKAFGIGKRVAKNQSSLGIRIQYLDGLAGEGCDYVARLCRRTARHVFASWYQAYDVDWRLQSRKRPYCPEHACSAGHVELHLVHFAGW